MQQKRKIRNRIQTLLSTSSSKIFEYHLFKASPTILVCGAMMFSCGESKENSQEDPNAIAEENPSTVSVPRGADAIGQGSGTSSTSGSVPNVSGVSDVPDLTSMLTNDLQIYEYAQKTLSSVLEGKPSEPGGEKPLGLHLSATDGSQWTTSYFLSGMTAASAVQSSLYPACTADGEPWDVTLKAGMDPTKREYAQVAFYCQLNAADTTKTVRGALDQNRRILCDIEKTLGALAYSSSEKTYSNVTLNLTPSCGWTPNDLQSLGRTQLVGKITTQALAGPEWQKKLVLDFPSTGSKVKSIQLTLYVSVTKTTMAFKELQSWNMSEEKNSNQYIAQGATGVHGHVIQLDYAAGTLRAETADTYWGRRVRLLARGVLDASTGKFKSVDQLQGVYAKFNKAGGEAHTYIDNAVATVTGNASAGFAYLSGIYHCPQDAACNPNNDELYTLTILNQSKINCVPLTAKCVGNQGFPLNVQKNTLDFLMLGAAWDDQVQKRSSFEQWLTAAGIPKFNSVDFSPVLSQNGY